ncbi:hypothetical protein ACY1J9_001329 [Clostridium botulinum]
MFLYVLKIPRYNAIKIGIATSQNRIKQHINTYEEIDLKESYIIKAKLNSTIKQLEKQLLEDYCDFQINDKELRNKDGYTELRNICIVNDLIEDIEYKSKRFKDKEIEVIKGVDVKKQKERKENDKEHEALISKQNKQNENLLNQFIDYIKSIKINIFKINKNNELINELWFKFEEKEKDKINNIFISKNFKYDDSSSCIVKHQKIGTGINKKSKDTVYLLYLKLNYYDAEGTNEEFEVYFNKIQSNLYELFS